MTLQAIFSRAAPVAALLSFLSLLVINMGTPAGATNFRKDKLTLHTANGQHVIEIEVAETLEQKQLGLMFREKVPPKTGMLFPYGNPQEVTMWMRNTYASLDMVFIRADGTVHRIEENTTPLSERIVSSKGNVTAVLELAAGESRRLGLKAGDRVEHATFKSKK